MGWGLSIDQNVRSNVRRAKLTRMVVQTRALIAIRFMFMMRNLPPFLTDVENLGVMLKPIQITCQFLRDVALAPGWQPNHDNDKL